MENREILSDVSADNEAGQWYLTHGATGEVDPKILAPDPLQPRKFMVKGELNELTISIAHSGVRQRLTVSPLSKMPWIKTNQVPEGCRFLISSGHRRQLAAIEAKLTSVPIEIKIYPNEQAHREDAALLNAQHSNLSPLEESYEIARRKELGEGMDDIGASFGNGKAWAMQRLSLTRLAPEIQERLNPNLGKDRVLATTMAAELGGVGTPPISKVEQLVEEHDLDIEIPNEPEGSDAIRFTYQIALLQVIDNREMNAIVAKDFITQSKHSHGGMRRNVERHQDKKGRRGLERYLKNISGHIIPSSWDDSDFYKIVSLMDMSEVNALKELGEKANSDLDRVLNGLETACQKKLARSTTTTSIERNANTASPLPKVGSGSVSTKAPQPNKSLPKEEPRNPTKTPQNGGSAFTPIIANYWSDDVGRFVSGEIKTAEHYLELYDKGDFKWQQEGGKRPPHLPDPSKIRAAMYIRE